MSIGDKVVIDRISPGSYALYRGFKSKNPMIVCPCNFQNYKASLTIEDIVGQAAILSYDETITIALLKDLKEQK